jgi:hypothetical protein
VRRDFGPIAPPGLPESRGSTGPPLLVLLLPRPLEQFELRERARELLAAPGAVAVEPARVSYRTLRSLGLGVAFSIAHRQAKRMRLPGRPRAIALFDELQFPLALAIAQRHPGGELWQLGPEPSESVNSVLTLDLAAAADLRPAWERMEAIGIESGRLGSERAL